MFKTKQPFENVKNYTKCTLQNALKAVSLGMSKKEASRKFKVPRQTIQGRVLDRAGKVRKGPDMVPTTAEESEIVSW